MSEDFENPTHQDTSNISQQVVRNALELQGLQILQGAADSLRDERLSGIMLKNNAMMKWLQDPSNKDYKEIASEIGGCSSLKDDIKGAYQYALKLVGATPPSGKEGK